jgi:hypothetical protein
MVHGVQKQMHTHGQPYFAKEKGVRRRWAVYFASAMLSGGLGGALPARAGGGGAVARELVELQQSVNQLIRGHKDIETTLLQNSAVARTLIEQSVDKVNKLTGNMMALQKTVQEMEANSGARLDTMATAVEGISDNLQETLARVDNLNRQLTDLKNSLQEIDAKLADQPHRNSRSYLPPPSNSPANPSRSAQVSQPATNNTVATILLYLKDGATYSVQDCWMDNGNLHYTFSDGAEGTVDIDQLDLQRTLDANSKRLCSSR